MEFIAVLLGLVLLVVIGYAFLAKKVRGPEPSNPHDEFAVKVLFDRVFVGYVPGFMSEEISENLNAGVEYQCNFIHVNDDGCLRVGIIEVSE